MFVVVCCLLFEVCCYSVFVVGLLCCLLLRVYRALCVVRWSLRVVSCVLCMCVVRCILLLFVVCLVCVVCCELLMTVFCDCCFLRK